MKHFPARMLLVALMAAAAPAPADVAPPDWRQQQSEEVWNEKLRPQFDGREINEGPAQDVVKLTAPYRAEDAAVVPISIHAGSPQSGDSFIKRIHVYIDKNPVPLVGIFEFTPESGRADLALRVRVDDFSYVRAIAETSDGKLYMAKSFVRATGACSAPPPKSIGDSIANMGQTRMKAVGELEFDQPTLVQIMIKHPNITGLQPMRIGSRVLPPPHFLRDLNISYNGKPVMKAMLTFSISMDPSFRFFFLPREAGTMTVEAVDTKENRWITEHAFTAS